MEKKYKNILEFNKIQDMLADCTTNSISRDMVYKLEPSSDMDEVSKFQEELAYTIKLLLKKGNPDISGLCDVTASIKRGEKGGIFLLSCYTLESYFGIIAVNCSYLAVK